MDKQEKIEEIARQAEALLQRSRPKVDALLIKTASIRTQLDQLKRELSEQLAQQDSPTPSETH